MPRTPKQKRSVATVNAIIKAGFLCVGENGLAATTTRHIAKRAGVGVGSVYEYFADKDAIYHAMAERFIGDLARMITEITPELVEADPEGLIRILLNNFRQILQRDDSLYLRYAREASYEQLKASQPIINRVLIDLLMKYLVKHPELAQVPNIPGTSYFLIQGGSYAVMNHLMDPAPSVTFDELVDAIAKIVGAGVSIFMHSEHEPDPK
ncbi:MAG: TetR/AcrR family transcriptional regulator [Ketobacteraceae bacterium]|nr:TetR/AcrR family transcriptional regulator [Ketobacteraceae bacterium]